MKKKVTIEFEAVYEEGRTFGECLNALLDTYYSVEGAEAPSFFMPVFMCILYQTAFIISLVYYTKVYSVYYTKVGYIKSHAYIIPD